MNIAEIGGLVCIVGAIGGLINCAITGEFVLPQMDSSRRAWRPGWIGNVFIGAVAAAVVWAMYGPLASYDLAAPVDSKPLTLTLSQLLVSVIIGLGGGNILTQLAQRQADQLVKENLLASLGNVRKTQ